ncbi:MAG TPA: MBL fold metallo-hydrolase [Alphaproteobacteria bacterium]|nr:MBL fold metallo-hydrolase [Alphaproteobacteria bacterium]
MKITMLGSGTSGGVPRIDGYWGAADPANPKNRRRRVSILVQSETTNVIVDTSPDFRQQCLDAGVTHVDGVLYTHDHADHVHGIDDLRTFRTIQGKRIDIYASRETLDVIRKRFTYIFNPEAGYRPICEPHEIKGPLTIGDIDILPYEQQHGPITSLGYRFGPVAYSTDLNGLSEDAFAALEGIDVWIVDGLRYDPHPTHAHLDLTLSWIERVKPKRAILTHMTWEMDYDTLCGELPNGVEPGYDGLTIEI